MKKLQLKQKITSVIKRFPHYIFVGGFIFFIALIITVLWLVHRSNATNDFNLVKSYPLTPLADATFNQPQGISHDASGNIYVADTGNARIEKFDSDGNFISQFGSRGYGNGSLSKPVDLVVAPDGYVYVTNTNSANNGNSSWQVVKYNSSGTWVETWEGATDYNSISAMIAADSSSNIYVYDGNNYNVTKYDSSGNQLTQWPLEKPEGWGCSGCIGGIAVDSNNVIYVGNSIGGQNRVDRFDQSGNDLGPWASGYYVSDISIDTSDNLYVASSTDIYKFDNQGSLAAHWGGYASGTPTNGLFTGVIPGILATNGHVWAVESSPLASRLQEFTSSGVFEKTVGSLGDGQLAQPAAISVDGSGNLDVVDYNRIQVFDTSTGAYELDYAPYGSSDGTAYLASGVATDASGNKYISDMGNNRVQKFDSSGNFITKWGSSGSGNGQFSGMSDIISDASGNTYVADTYNNRIQKFDSSGNFVTKWSTNTAPVDLDFDRSGNILVIFRFGGTIQKFNSTGTSLGTITLESSGSYVTGIALDSSDNIYTTEYDAGYGYVAMYSPTGSRWGKWGSQGAGDLQFNMGTFSDAPDIAVDSSDHIFIADYWNNRVQEFTHDFQLTIDSNVLDDGEVNAAYSDAIDYSGVRNNLAFSITSGNLPDGLVLDTATGAITGTPTTAGNYTFTIQVQDDSYSDSENFTIHVSPAQTVPDVTTKTADNIGIDNADLHGSTSPKGVTERGFEYGLTTSYGQTSIDSSDIGEYSAQQTTGTYGTGNSQFDSPLNIKTDTASNVYIVDTWNHRIQKFDKHGNYLSQFGAFGVGDGQLKYPHDIAVAPDGSLYVADWQNNRIQKFDVDGNYLAKWTPQNGSVVWSLAADSQGNIYATVQLNSANGSVPVVQKYSADGTFLAQWGSSGSGDGQFDYAGSPARITVDSNDDIYVIDIGNSRMQKFDSDGNFLLTIGGTGSGYNGRGDDPGEFNGISDVAVNSEGHIFIADASDFDVQEFTAQGSYIKSFSVYDPPFSVPFGYRPIALDFDLDDSLYLLTPSHTGDGIVIFGVYDNTINTELSSLNCGTTYHYRAYSTNNIGTSYGDDQTFTTDACPQVSIDTASLPNGQVAEAYSQTVATSGGSGAQTFSVASGSLPSGLALNTATGEITGTATAAGDFTFSISVTDDYSNAIQPYTVTIAPLDNPLVESISAA